MSNPKLELHNANSTIGTNDNWQTTQLGGVITSDQVAAIQNSGFPPNDPAEPAIIAILPVLRVRLAITFSRTVVRLRSQGLLLLGSVGIIEQIIRRRTTTRSGSGLWSVVCRLLRHLLVPSGP